MRDVFDRRWYLEIIKIGANKDVTCVFRRWFQSEIDRNACMQADAGDIDGICKGGLVHEKTLVKRLNKMRAIEITACKLLEIL